MKDHTILLVDASGSMCSHEKETQEAIVSIIKETNPETHLTLVFFDTGEYKVLADNLAKNIQPELGYLFKALGGTPITDSVYKAIQDVITNVDVEQLAEPHKLIVFCDGGENSSHFVKPDECGAAIEHLTENFGWDFKFIGPKSEERNILKYTESLKIKRENVSLYASMSEGLEEMKKVAA